MGDVGIIPALDIDPVRNAAKDRPRGFRYAGLDAIEIAHAAFFRDRTDHLVGFEPDLFGEVCCPGHIFRRPIPCPFDGVDEIAADIACGMFRHRAPRVEVVRAVEVVVEDRTENGRASWRERGWKYG